MCISLLNRGYDDADPYSAFKNVIIDGNTSYNSGCAAVAPNDFGFFIAFLATIPVLLLIMVYMKRKPGASGWVRKIWHKGKQLLLATAVLNMIIIFIPFLMDLTHKINMLGWGQLAIAAYIVFYLSTTQRVKDTFADFPKDESEIASK